MGQPAPMEEKKNRGPAGRTWLLMNSAVLRHVGVLLSGIKTTRVGRKEATCSHHTRSML